MSSKEAERPCEVSVTDLDPNKWSFQAIIEMRIEFPDVDDNTLARFLVARNGDIKKAKLMLQAHLDWKSANWPVLKEEIAEEALKGRIYVRGVDKQGLPIIVWNVRLHDGKNRDLAALTRLSMWWIEYALSKLPADKSKITVIMNRIDFRSENQDIEFCKRLADIFSNNYPERLRMVVVYPSGLVFYGLWAIVKLFLDPVTQKKVLPCVYFVGVQDHIDDAWIPENMGGKDSYEFNFDDFADPYPEEVIAAVKTKQLLTTSSSAEQPTSTDEPLESDVCKPEIKAELNDDNTKESEETG